MEQIKKKQRSEKDFKRLSKEEKEMAREIKGKLPRAAKKKQKDQEEVEEKPQKNKIRIPGNRVKEEKKQKVVKKSNKKHKIFDKKADKFEKILTLQENNKLITEKKAKRVAANEEAYSKPTGTNRRAIRRDIFAPTVEQITKNNELKAQGIARRKAKRRAKKYFNAQNKGNGVQTASNNSDKKQLQNTRRNESRKIMFEIENPPQVIRRKKREITRSEKMTDQFTRKNKTTGNKFTESKKTLYIEMKQLRKEQRDQLKWMREVESLRKMEEDAA